MSLFIAVLAQTSVLILAALAAMRLAKSGAVRVAIGRSALLGVLALAVAAPLTAGRIKPVFAVPAEIQASAPVTEFPPNRVPIPAANVQAPPASSRPAKVVSDLPASFDATSSAQSAEPHPSAWSFPPRLLWGMGVLLSLIAMTAGHLALAALRRRAKSVSSGPVFALLNEIAPARRPELRESGDVQSPFLCGVARAAILLPLGLDEEELLRPILTHEVSHFTRKDVPWAYFGRALHALLWFQPLLWWLRREIVTASEEVCDAEAVRMGCAPTAYANCLLQLAAKRQRGLAACLTAGMASSKPHLAHRVEAILNGTLVLATRLSPRGRAGIAAGTALALTSGAILVAPAFSQTVLPGDTDAKTAWEKTIAAYRSLSSISYTQNVLTPHGSSMSMSTFVFAPGRRMLRIRYDQSSIAHAATKTVMDGKFRYDFNPEEPRSFLKIPVTEPVGAWEGAPPAEPRYDSAPLDLFFGDRAARARDAYVNANTVLKPGEKIDGVDTFCLETPTVLPVGPGSVQTYIGRNDHLIRKIVRKWQDGQTKGMDVITFTNVRPNVLIASDTFRFVPPPGAVEGHGIRLQHHDPRAEAVFQAMIGASRALKSSRAYFVSTTELNGAVVNRQVRRVVFKAPNFGRSESVLGKLRLVGVSDGKRVVVQNMDDPKRYFGQPVTSQDYFTYETLMGTGGYRDVYARNPDVAMAYCAQPVYGDYGFSILRLGAPAKIDGEPMDVVEISSPVQNTIGVQMSENVHERFYISQRDHLVRKHEEWVNTLQPSGQVNRQRWVTTVSKVEVNPELNDVYFRSAVGADAKPITKKTGVERQWFDASEDIQIGRPAPSLTGVLTDGRPFQLSDLKGKVVVLYAWTPGVVDSPADIAGLRKLRKEFSSKDLEIVGLAVDMSKGYATAKSKEQGFTWPSLLDGPSMKKWNLHLFPFEAVIDRDGILQGRNLFPEARAALVRSLVNRR